MVFRKEHFLSIYYVPGNDISAKYFECNYVMQIRTMHECD